MNSKINDSFYKDIFSMSLEEIKETYPNLTDNYINDMFHTFMYQSGLKCSDPLLRNSYGNTIRREFMKMNRPSYVIIDGKIVYN